MSGRNGKAFSRQEGLYAAPLVVWGHPAIKYHFARMNNILHISVMTDSGVSFCQPPRENLPWVWKYRSTVRSQLRGSRPVLSCENGRVGVNVKKLWPTDRSQNCGRTKSLSDSETDRSVIKLWSDKVNNWLFHFSHERTGREPRRLAAFFFWGRKICGKTLWVEGTLIITQYLGKKNHPAFHNVFPQILQPATAISRFVWANSLNRAKF
jgi:hypothetical protein